MNSLNTKTRYGTVSIALHWATLGLLIAVYACIELREIFPKGSELREALKAWHFMLGLSVFILVWPRLALVKMGGIPPIEPVPPHWQHVLGRVAQTALYALMIAMPLLGWLLLSVKGKPIPFFGLQWPALVGENAGWAEWVLEIHETGGALGYWIIGLHACAALFHHYILRDNTLRRMFMGQD